MKNIYFVISLILIGILFSSCKEDDLTNEDNFLNSDCINLKVEVPSLLTTKGIPIDSAMDDLFTKIGIYGYPTVDDIDFANSPSASLFSNVSVNRNESDWNFDRTYYWPQTGVVSFIAYYPYIDPSVSNSYGLSIVNQDVDTIPLIKYTVPNEVANQPDLMIATPVLNASREVVKLNFNHALACISFNVSGPDVPIDSIYLTGVSTSGNVYMCLDSNNKPYWSYIAAPDDNQFKIGLIDNPVAEDPSIDIMATDGYLMMIPQVLSDKAKLYVKFKGLPVREISLNSTSVKEWVAGNKYIYTLDEGVYTFDVTCDSIDCPYLGGVFNLNIKSIYTKANEIVIDTLGWTTKVTYNNGSGDDWVFGIDTINNSIGGEQIVKTLQMKLSPYSSEAIFPDADDDSVLQDADSIPLAQIKDLSEGITANTYFSANCYMINAPGWYKFPCWVIGNGLSGSSSKFANRLSNLNDKCFSANDKFLKYNGDDISVPSDLIMSGTNLKAELIWSDAPDIVTEISILKDDSGNDEYISFYVPKQNIRMGNALIALKNSQNDIMWSWHLWFSAWSIESYFENVKQSETFYGINLGYTLPAKYSYPERSVTIEFTQNVTGITKSITLTQKSENYTYYSSALYYQWGRKDPFIGAEGVLSTTQFSESNKKMFNSNGPISFISQSGNVSLDVAIKNPMTFYTSSTNWNSNNNVDLWSIPANIQGSDSIFYKTIYDPSPMYFSVPSLAIFNSLEEYEWNPIQVAYVYRYYGVQSTILFPAIGQRSNTTSNVEFLAQKGFYWSNSYSSSSPVGFQYLFIDSSESSGTSATTSFESGNTANGFIVMPAIYSRPNSAQ